MTLLEKARKMKSRKNASLMNEEFMELSLAWIKGDINGSQFTVAIGRDPKSSHYLYKVALAVREAYKRGRVNIK